MKRLTIKEYSQKTGVSAPTIYKRIEKGLLQSEKEGRNIFILVEEEENEEIFNEVDKDKEFEILSQENRILEEKIKNLEQINNSLVEDKKNLYKQLEQSNILQLKALETLKTLEYQKEQVETKLEEEKSKKWWQKIF